MKIENLNVSGGQVNIADKIEKIIYKPNFGISENEFQTLVASLKNLNGQQFTDLKDCFIQINDAQTLTEKTTLIDKTKKILFDLGISFASSLTIDGIVQLGQALLS
ncbi:MAG TPA: hypothetical protein VK175_15650 [Leadbetterella sp.]|nr:hypothetical protein [Leadbetterella sp.]